MSEPRVMIVGCGRMGTVRAAAASHFGARIVAAVDPVPARAETLAALHPGSRALWSIDEVDWDAIDAAFVCTPPGHRGPELRAVEAGVPVLIEKPLSVTALEARDLVDTVAERGARAAVGYMNRYRQGVTDLRERLLETPAFAITAYWVAGRYAKPWWNDERLSGGPLNDLASHLIDLARFLCGEITTVVAVAPGSQAGDLAAAALRFESGACATILSSSRATAKHIGFEVFTPGGVHRLEGWDLHRRGTQAEPGFDAAFAAETAAFLSGQPMLSDVADAWRTQVVVDAIKTACSEQRQVEVPR